MCVKNYQTFFVSWLRSLEESKPKTSSSSKEEDKGILPGYPVQSWQKGRLQSKIFSGSVLSATQLATDGTPKKGARQRLVCDCCKSGRSSSLHKSFEKGKIMMLWACLGYPSKTWKGLKGTGKGRFFSCFSKEFTYVFKIFTGKVKGKGTAVMVKFTANWIPKLHVLRPSFITYVYRTWLAAKSIVCGWSSDWTLGCFMVQRFIINHHY